MQRRLTLQNNDGLSNDILRMYFRRFGKVNCISRKNNVHDTYVWFHTSDSAIAAYRDAEVKSGERQHYIKDKYVTVGLSMSEDDIEKELKQTDKPKMVKQDSKPKTVKNDPCQLFVHDMELLTRDDLMAYFVKYGVVTSVDLPPSALSPKGYKYGFVWFSSPGEARAAFKAGAPIGNERRHCIMGSMATVYVMVKHDEEEEKETEQVMNPVLLNSTQPDSSILTGYIGPV